MPRKSARPTASGTMPQDDHEGAAHRPEEFDSKNPQKQVDKKDR
ncbi:hypothetical protein [Sulfitobacter maritimus]|nr:hypothetical protein [Sulfitobacter maritimus]